MFEPVCLACRAMMRESYSWEKILSFSLFKRELFPPLAEWLCRGCLLQVERLGEDGCVACSRSLQLLEQQYIYSTEAGPICYDCYRWEEWQESMQMGEILSSNISGLAYNEWAQELLADYKFAGEERYKYFFVSLLLEEIHRRGPSSFSCFDYITPIPLSPTRLWERGFNQADLVAQLLAQQLGVAYEQDVLVRQADEGKQSKKGREQRLKEMFQKFVKNRESLVDIVDKRILLVDDVYTTGATLYSAAYALREAGANQVCSITIAR